MPTSRRSRKSYDQLYDNPAALFGSAEVLLWYQGRPEIIIRSRDGKRGIRLTANDTLAGLGVNLTPISIDEPLDLYPGVSAEHVETDTPSGLPQIHEVQHLAAVQYRPDMRPRNLRRARRPSREHQTA